MLSSLTVEAVRFSFESVSTKIDSNYYFNFIFYNRTRIFGHTTNELSWNCIIWSLQRFTRNIMFYLVLMPLGGYASKMMHFYFIVCRRDSTPQEQCGIASTANSLTSMNLIGISTTAAQRCAGDEVNFLWQSLHHNSRQPSSRNQRTVRRTLVETLWLHKTTLAFYRYRSPCPSMAWSPNSSSLLQHSQR